MSRDSDGRALPSYFHIGLSLRAGRNRTVLVTSGLEKLFRVQNENVNILHIIPFLQCKLFTACPAQGNDGIDP